MGKLRKRTCADEVGSLDLRKGDWKGDGLELAPTLHVALPTPGWLP